MNIGAIILSSIFLFLIIYFAVRLAIDPLLIKTEQIITDDQDFGLVKLRDIEVLSDTELEEVIELFQNKSVKKEDYKQYQKYAKVLSELNGIGYLTDEQYSEKKDKLKRYFKID